MANTASTAPPEHPVRNAAEAKQLAKFHAGLIIEAALGEGWGSNPGQIDKWGPKGAALVEAEMTKLAEKLVQGVRVG